MDPGTLVFINGNQAAIVLGDGVGDDGQNDGSLIVGTFASAEKIEAGHFGGRPGPAAENTPSFLPPGAQPTQAGPVQTFVPTAGDTSSSDLGPVDDAGAVDATQTQQTVSGPQAGGGQAGSRSPVEGVTARGSTDVDFEAANRTGSDDVAELGRLHDRGILTDAEYDDAMTRAGAPNTPSTGALRPADTTPFTPPSPPATPPSSDTPTTGDSSTSSTTGHVGDSSTDGGNAAGSTAPGR